MVDGVVDGLMGGFVDDLDRDLYLGCRLLWVVVMDGGRERRFVPPPSPVARCCTGNILKTILFYHRYGQINRLWHINHTKTLKNTLYTPNSPNH